MIKFSQQEVVRVVRALESRGLKVGGCEGASQGQCRFEMGLWRLVIDVWGNAYFYDISKGSSNNREKHAIGVFGGRGWYDKLADDAKAKFDELNQAKTRPTPVVATPTETPTTPERPKRARTPKAERRPLLDTEEWRDVPHFPGIQVSRTGHFRSLRKGRDPTPMRVTARRQLQTTYAREEVTKEHEQGALAAGVRFYWLKTDRAAVMTDATEVVMAVFGTAKPSERAIIAFRDNDPRNWNIDNLYWIDPQPVRRATQGRSVG